MSEIARHKVRKPIGRIRDFVRKGQGVMGGVEIVVSVNPTGDSERRTRMNLQWIDIENGVIPWRKLLLRENTPYLSYGSTAHGRQANISGGDVIIARGSCVKGAGLCHADGGRRCRAGAGYGLICSINCHDLYVRNRII